MKKIFLAITVMMNSVAFANFPAAVEKAAEDLKQNDVKIVITEIGKSGERKKSYQVDLQVKQASYDHMESKVVYAWKTVKTAKVENTDLLQIKLDNVKTVISEIENDEGNPCLSEGSYLVELQVSDGSESSWKTVKTITVEEDGGVMEVCAE